MAKKRRLPISTLAAVVALLGVVAVLVWNPSWREEGTWAVYDGMKGKLGGREPIGVAGRLSDERRGGRSAGRLVSGNQAYGDQDYGAGSEAVDRCGSYRLQQSRESVEPEGDVLDVLRIYGKGAEPLKTFAYPRLEVVGCKDITADAVPELLVERYTGGNFGYWISWIYSMDPELTERLVLETRTGIDFSDMRNLDRHPALEILAYDSSLAGLPGLINARSPAVLGILCLNSGRYRDCTAHFPEVLQMELEDVETRLRASLLVSEKPAEDPVVRAVALEFFALHYLLQEEDAGWGRLVELVPRDVLQWLKRHHAVIFRRLDARASRLY